jgi:hypothetical protein
VRRFLLGAPFVLVFGVLFLFYAWTASNGSAFSVGEPQEGLYNLLTDALVKGQLHLRVEPDPGLFELADPYEPTRNVRVRLHDASLYRGHYYLYFGVVPAIVLLVPWRLAGLGDLPEPLAATLFATVGLVFWTLLLRALIRRHLPDTPRWARLVGVVTLGLASVVPFALRGASVYEVALTAGYLFLGAAAWLFTTADTSRPSEEGRTPGLSLRRVALGSLCLGLAVGCRPNQVLLLPLVPLLALPAWRACLARRGRALLALALPAGLVILLLGAYNKARFDSWFELGMRYQLGRVRPVPWFEASAVPPVVWFQFLAPPRLSFDFPFVLPMTRYPGQIPEGFFAEPYIVGLLSHAPFVLVLFAAPWVLRRTRAPDASTLRARVGVLVAAGLVSPLVTAFVFAAAAMRYQIDFASFLVIAALVVWALVVRQAAGWRRRGLAALGLAACAGSWLLAVTLSLSGGYDELHRWNPELWTRLERACEPIHIALGRLLERDGRLVVSLRAAFPERAVSAQEAFLSWGHIKDYDVLWVKQVGPGVFSFRLDTARERKERSATPPPSPALSLEPGVFYDMRVDIDRVRHRVSVSVSGGPGFTLAGRLSPVDRNRLWTARGPRGHGATPLARFSGALISQALLDASPPGLLTLPPLASLPALLTGAGEGHPAGAAKGQLHVVAGHRGAYLFTGDSWRWIPQDYLDRVQLVRALHQDSSAVLTREPLLVSGDAAAADAVLALPRGGGRLAFVLAQFRGGWSILAEGPAIDPLAVRPATVTVVLDRVAREATVDIASRRVLSAATDLLPLEGSQLSIGSMPPGLNLETLPEDGGKPATGHLRRPLTSGGRTHPRR